MNAADGARAGSAAGVEAGPAPLAEPRGAPPDHTPVARVEAVGLAARDGSALLSRLSFALPPGSVHVLTGAPGAGKSRVLALLGLEARPASGRIQLFGRDVATLRPREIPAFRRRIGRVHATDRLLAHLTVFDNAALVPRLAGRKDANFRGEVTDVLAWMGLAGRLDSLPEELDAAGRRRLALARAVANRPDLLLVDEPGAGLDERGAADILARLAGLNAVGTTLVMVIADEKGARKTGAPLLRLADGTMSLAESAGPVAST